MDKEDMIFWRELLEKPKIEIGISEKRSIGNYENKEYTARMWIPIGLNITSENISRMMDELQRAIIEQEKKDGIKPTRAITQRPENIKSIMEKALRG